MRILECVLTLEIEKFPQATMGTEDNYQLRDLNVLLVTVNIFILDFIYAYVPWPSPPIVEKAASKPN